MSATPPNSVEQGRRLIAPVWHTILLLVFLAIPLIAGLILQNRETASNQIFASHSMVMLRFYLPVLVSEWLLVLYIWAGLRRCGMTIKALIGGRWKSFRDVAVDLGLAVGIWIGMLGIQRGLAPLLGPSQAKSANILPESALEIIVWIVVSCTAGFVEELVFRGYLQTQFTRFGLPAGLAVVAQALVFALDHAYEGSNAVIVITAFALLFGVIASWRRSLRPGIIGHAWYDIAVIFFR
ncbi:MAG TPA: CPBP family intramembrane glutamic endopeptidase [Candidatus Angelobacter sp.]